MPRKWTFTPEQEAEFVRRYRNGEGAVTLAREIGAQSKVIERVLRAHDAYEPGRRFTGRYSPQQRAQVITRYSAGETMGAIAADLGCDRGNIRAMLVRAGVELRPPRSFPLSPETEHQLRQLRGQGLTFVDIARALGVPKHRVLVWARQIGLSEFIPKRGAASNLYTGGQYVDSNGYTYVAVSADDPMASMRQSNGYVRENRLVMARSLGRPLLPSETVHHIDTDKSNNRIENLQLRQGNHGKGGAFVCQDCGSHNVTAMSLKEA